MAIRPFSAISRLGAIALAALLLAACQESSSIPKDIRPVSDALVDKMEKLGMRETSPVLVRIFKESSELEVWKEQRDGKYALLKTYAICKWSGVLGPKIKEGDRQAPEGFYIVTPAQMNPKSSYYLSFNIGYPNAYDRAYGRTGMHLMVHGACSSAGCYSMTDEDAGEIFALARDAFKGGQREFQVQAFPFRMTPENLAKHADNQNMPFWQNLKVGYDHFEVSRQVPKVDVCGKKYVFNADAGRAKFSAAAACPPYTVPEWIASAVSAKGASDEQKFTAAIAKIENQELQAAEAQREAEEKAAAKASWAAEKANKPSVWSRWFGKDKDADEAPAAAAAPGDGAEPVSTGSVPPPKKKPATGAATTAPAPATRPVAAAATPAKPSAKAAAPAAPATAGSAQAAEPIPGATASTPPTVGKVVRREFDWPEEEAPAN